MTCPDGIGLLSEGHQMLYGPYIKSLKSWNDSGHISSTSTATIIALCESAKIRIWGYTHMNVAVM